MAGHSSGATIALQLTIDHPELVETLTLLAVARFLATVCSVEWGTCPAPL